MQAMGEMNQYQRQRRHDLRGLPETNLEHRLGQAGLAAIVVFNTSCLVAIGESFAGNTLQAAAALGVAAAGVVSGIVTLGAEDRLIERRVAEQAPELHIVD